MDEEYIRKEMLGKLGICPPRIAFGWKKNDKAVCSSQSEEASKTIGVTWSNFREIDTHTIIKNGLEKANGWLFPIPARIV